MRLAALLVVGCAGAPSAPLTAEACGSCHAEQYAAWSKSAHAKSGESEAFLRLLPRVEAAWGGVAKARCVTCHQPGHGETPGITCLSCHAAIGNRGEHDGQLVVEPGAPLSAASDVNAPHDVTRRSLLGSASLCITCHEVTGPQLFVEPTGTEYRAATSDDAACAQCHLEGHAFRGLDRLAEALKLEVLSDGRVTLTNVGAAHAVPTGVALLRDVWVDVETESGMQPRVIELGSRLHGGVLPTDADRIEPRALAPGESRTVLVPGARAAFLRMRPVRAEALDALGLEAPPPVDVSATR